MQLPQRLILVQSTYFSDGGSFMIYSRDELGQERRVWLMQRWCTGGHAAGRMCLDEVPIPVRSDLESRVLELLRKAEFSPPPRLSQQERRRSLSADDRRWMLLSELRAGRCDLFRISTIEESINGLQRDRDKIIAAVESPLYVSYAAKVEADQAAGIESYGRD